MAELTKLYRVTFDGQDRYVEAPDFPRAIEAWKAWGKAEWKEDYDGTEEPESVALVSDDPVIRLTFSEYSVGTSDRVDTRDYTEVR